ncbi:hypothetical protein EB796_010353 [Bugula neritina]|uniref:VWFA domain-containing protein n=1 Tax=Bugula neritina TaxID=10212 RepID=A0A7J7K092_BUGNE|nr:hypothetical protein EB796_010353 [Bugula neritina]
MCEVPKMPKFSKTAPSDSHVVTEDRFKILPVTSRISIRDFVAKHGITFAPGRGFYQLTKPETIQAYKEIVAVRVSDGAKVTGDAVRDLLKIPDGAAKFKYTQVDDFEVYVQSTSYNRVLMPDTKFLYEVKPGARGATSPKKRKVVLNEKRCAAPPPTVPGSPIDLVFSFDTTGSMYSCLDEVRKNLTTMIERILKDIPNIRIAVFAHGDYCDKDSTYVTKFIDFTQDTKKLVSFVKNVKGTGGGDFEECYELVLQQARTDLSWTPGSQRAMVMIGDAIPHTVSDYKQIMSNYKFVKSVVDWRKESDELIGIGCRVYAVQCSPGGYQENECAKFWQGLAFKTYGHHLELSNFSNVFDFIMAIAYKEQGAEQFEAYRQEVIKRTPGGEGMNADLHALFNSLAGDDDDDDGAAGAVAGPSTATDLFAAAVPVTPAGSKRKAAPATSTASKKVKLAAKKTPAKKTPAKKHLLKRPAKSTC